MTRCGRIVPFRLLFSLGQKILRDYLQFGKFWAKIELLAAIVSNGLFTVWQKFEFYGEFLSKPSGQSETICIGFDHELEGGLLDF